MSSEKLYVILPRWEEGMPRIWLSKLLEEFSRRGADVTAVAPVSSHPPNVKVGVFYVPRDVLTPYTSAPFSLPARIKELVDMGHKVILSMPYSSLALSLARVLPHIRGKYYVIWHHLCKETFLKVERKAHAKVLDGAKKVFVPYPNLPLPTDSAHVISSSLPYMDIPFSSYRLRVFLPSLKLYEPFPYRAMLRVKAGATPATFPGEWKDIWRSVLDMKLPTMREAYLWYKNEIWKEF